MKMVSKESVMAAAMDTVKAYGERVRKAEVEMLVDLYMGPEELRSFEPIFGTALYKEHGGLYCELLCTISPLCRNITILSAIEAGTLSVKDLDVSVTDGTVTKKVKSASVENVYSKTLDLYTQDGEILEVPFDTMGDKLQGWEISVYEDNRILIGPSWFLKNKEET